MEYLYGVLSSISRDLVCGVVNQLRYPCCFNNFVEELAKEEGNLIATRNSVKDRIAHAEKQTRRTAEVVDKWLENAEIDVDNVNNLLSEARTNNSCCFGHCPNWIFRYRLGKKLAVKKNELEKFVKEGGQYVQLERVATLPPGIIGFSSEKYLSFGSRQKAYEEIMEAVKDDEVGMIGLYGMGGCGKTTMAEKIKKIAEAEHLFDKVIFVPVSSTVQVRRIQDKIASSLGYDFPENEERERAIRLCTRLTQENKILVILDDVWEKLDFDSIGIPSTEHHKGCKVLITTRSRDVCNSMDCKTIHLPILEDEEAWTLFQKEANINEGTSDTVKHLARQISNECKGLPVAIAAVASTLKGKDEVIWKVALNRLKSSKPVSIEKGLQDPYKCLELSYHYLDTKEAKSLFLLCSVFPEDCEIPIQLLTRCAIGLGVVGEVRTYDEARSEVIAAKIKLVSSCLLMLVADDVGECVKMHDLVRDVAHLIAKNEDKAIKCKVENHVTLEHNSIRYLWCDKLPNDLDCSNLVFLCITTEVEVLDEIFTRMGQLRVLFLHNEKGERLPLSTMSFKTLTNLHCLILSGWKLSDISFVRDMKKLESLSLNECSLLSSLDLQKDDVVTQLTKLKSLVLSECGMERNIFEVIGRIPLLEELCIIDHSEEWNYYSENTIEFFKSFSVPQTLQRYTIQLGTIDARLFITPPERTLSLSCFHISNEAMVHLAKKAKILFMVHIEGGAKNIIPNIFQLEGGGMSELNDLAIRDSKEIECLVDTSNHMSEVEGNLFSNLLELRISAMYDLRVLWHGCLPPSGAFRKLETLHLFDCPQLTSLFTQAITPNSVRYTIFQNLQHVMVGGLPQLKYVFSANTVGGLPQLKTLRISYCCQLDQIIEYIIPSVLVMKCPLAQHDQRQELDEIIKDELHQHSFNSDLDANQLEIIPENTETPSASLVNHSSGSFTLSKLTSLNLESCPKLGSLFPASTAKTLISLEQLMIRDCHGLKHLLTCERAHNNKKQNRVEDGHDLQSVISMFLSLKSLYIRECDLLQHIFCVFFVGGQNDFEDSLCHLQHKNIQIGRQVSLVLEELELYDLPQMNCIWVASKNYFNLQYLKTLQITRCAKLEVIFTVSIVRCLPKLECLQIEECKELKQIMEEDVEDKKLSDIVSPQSCFPKLKQVLVIQCHKLEVIFPLSVIRCLPELESLDIRECKELKQIMEEEDENDTIKRELKPCIPKLTLLSVQQCHKLKHLFSMSASNGLPNLEALIIIHGADELEELIGCEQRKGKELGKAKVDLPKLKLLIFMDLSNLCQEIDLSAVKHCVIKNCPKLSLTSTTTLQELCEIFPKSDFENLGLPLWLLRNRIREIDESNDVLERRDTSEFLSSQINEELESEFMGEVYGLKVHDPTTSTYSELDGRSSSSPLDIHHLEKNIDNIKIGVKAGTTLENAMMVSSHLESTSSQLDSSEHKSYARELDSKPENNSPLQMNQEDPLTSKSKSPLSRVNDNNQSILGSIAEMVRGHNQVQNEAPVFETGEFLELERERERTSHLQSLEQKLPPISSPNMTVKLVGEKSSNETGFPDQHALGETTNFEEIGKESTQEGSMSEGAIVKTLSIGVESISLGSGVAIHSESSDEDILTQHSQVIDQDDKLNESKKGIQIREESNLMDKKEGTCMVSNNTIEVSPDTHTRLGAHKHFVDLDDAQIAILAEAITTYPHLWNACEKFSERFQAWMLKTLADMLLFLRNENVVSVTPRRENEFHKLCDEAIQLGFERSWVDEMRQRVVARDPELDHAQARIGELLNKHDHLTQELRNTQNELKRLNDFVDAQTKCFNFL